MTDRRIINEIVNSVESVNGGTSENSTKCIDQAVSETVIVIRSDEEDVVRVSGQNGDLNMKANVVELSKALVDEPKVKDTKEDEHLCVIDMKRSGGGKFGENLDGERVCRICHLSSDQSTECTTSTANVPDLIQLGCDCKDDLGIAHSHCAEVWFKLKGNRLCEICGKAAKNITGVGDNRFMEEWNERRSTGIGNNSSDRNGGCWRGQPFCNFLMACLVIAFVLPWFFRVNMF